MKKQLSCAVLGAKLLRRHGESCFFIFRITCDYSNKLSVSSTALIVMMHIT